MGPGARPLFGDAGIRRAQLSAYWWYSQNLAGHALRSGFRLRPVFELRLAITPEQGLPPSRAETALYKSLAPFPTAVGFRPFDEPLHPQYGIWPRNARLSFDRPVAYIQRHFEARDIRMKDLVIP